jgi:hypothetical protein
MIELRSGFDLMYRVNMRVIPGVYELFCANWKINTLMHLLAKQILTLP